MELTERKDAAILDTLANLLFVQGKVDEAIVLQKEAVPLADGPMKHELALALAKFEAAAALPQGGRRHRRRRGRGGRRLDEAASTKGETREPSGRRSTTNRAAAAGTPSSASSSTSPGAIGPTPSGVPV